MIRSIILGVILLYLQIFKAGDMTVLGVIPNFFIAYSGYAGAYLPQKRALPLIFVLGLAYDLMFPETLGLNTFLFLVFCIVIDYLSRTILEQKLITTIIISLLCNALYFLIFGLFYSLYMDNYSFLISKFITSTIVNGVISVILFYFFLVLSEVKLTLKNVS